MTSSTLSELIAKVRAQHPACESECAAMQLCDRAEALELDGRVAAADRDARQQVNALLIDENESLRRRLQQVERERDEAIRQRAVIIAAENEELEKAERGLQAAREMLRKHGG